MNQETQSWAEQEFGNADLGDYRRTRRLIQIAEQRCSQPNASITQSLHNRVAVMPQQKLHIASTRTKRSLWQPFYPAMNKLLRHV